jgi:hypothetical protein
MLHEIAACLGVTGAVMLIGGLLMLAFYLLVLCLGGRAETPSPLGFLISSIAIVMIDLTDLIIGRFGAKDVVAAVVAVVLLRLYFVERETIAIVVKARQAMERETELIEKEKMEI